MQIFGGDLQPANRRDRILEETATRCRRKVPEEEKELAQDQRQLAKSDS